MRSTLAGLAVVFLSLSLAKASPGFNAVQADAPATFELRPDSVMTPQDIENAKRDLLIREELAAAIAHAEKERSRRRNNHRPSASPGFASTAVALATTTSQSLHSHRPSHTPSGTYTPSSPSKSYNGLSASASASAQAHAKAKRELEEAKRVLMDSPWEGLDHSLLCPGGETACPIFPRLGSWECLDTMSELESCGGCTSKGQGEDCTAIKGAQGVTCDHGKCLVFTCTAGYKLDLGRCHKMKTSVKA